MEDLSLDIYDRERLVDEDKLAKIKALKMELESLKENAGSSITENEFDLLNGKIRDMTLLIEYAEVLSDPLIKVKTLIGIAKEIENNKILKTT